MSSAPSSLTPSELRAIMEAVKEKAWITLVERYPNDPTIIQVRAIDEKLAAVTSAQTDMPRKTPIAAEQNTGTVMKVAEVDKMIYEESINLFEKSVLEPAFGKDMVVELRKAGVPLPEESRAATSRVSGVYSDNPTTFKKFAGKGKNAPAKWHLETGE